ncbi:DNA repair protein RadA [bacterium]|nr:DNA repair protein RadA [bacterium]
MKKQPPQFECGECGYRSPKQFGKCPECGAWNSMSVSDPIQQVSESHTLFTIPELQNAVTSRTSCDIEEWDRVLGGGLVTGSVILIGGEPGIGKSTLLLQVAHALAKQKKTVLYASGEESPSQISLRASRLGVNAPEIWIDFETDLEKMEQLIQQYHPDFLIVDSIQTIYHPNLDASSGSVSQIRESTNFLVQLAKRNNLTVFIVGHVTKDGQIAGPKFLEHLVDVVLYLEGDRHGVLRILRSVKNRFGETSEIGIFTLSSEGLISVEDPTELFLNQNSTHSPGTIIFSSLEGIRPIFVEIQALCVPSFLPVPRRVITGVDFNRIIMLMAVCEKRSGLRFSQMDVFFNVTGGARITEPAADLAIALALVSSLKEIPLPEKAVAFGEIGLTGEIRPIPFAEKRILESARRQFNPIITGKLKSSSIETYTDQLLMVTHLTEAVEKLF